MHTEQVGRFILPSGAFCYAVWRHTEEMAWANTQMAELRVRVLGEASHWLTPELSARPGTLRMIILGYDNDYHVGFLLEAGVGDLTTVAV